MRPRNTAVFFYIHFQRIAIFVFCEEIMLRTTDLKMKQNIKFLYSTLLALALLASSCSKDNLDPAPELPEPGKEERLAENPKLKSAVRTMMSEAAKMTDATLNGVAVWQEGYAPSGAWGKGADNATRRQMWSVTKTFTSMAVGIAVGEGKLSLSEKVAPMFPEEVAAAEKNMTDAQRANLEALTVRHLLIMANGHKKDPTIEYATEYFKKDPFGCYDSFSSCILSEIITKKTGETMADYLYTRMFKPLGLDKPEWEDIQGVTAGGWGLHLSTDEMLSFGRLLLDGGKWNGQQIIPAYYLNEAVKDQIKDRMNYGQNYSTTGYGYQIRTRSDGSFYMAVGLFGQYIVVLPEKKAVIALTSAMPFDADNILKDLSKVMDMLNGNLDSSVKPLELAWKYIVPEL